MIGRAVAQHSVDLGLQRLLMLVAQRVGVEQRVFRQIGPAERLR